MTSSQKTVAIRVGTLVAFVALLAWFLVWRTGQTWQYEVVQEGKLYRCSARTPEEFTASAAKVMLQGMAVAGTQPQMESPALTTAVNYGHKSRARVSTYVVPPDQFFAADKVQRFLDYVANPRRHPVLLVDADGRAAGMLTAAYRLSVMRLPLPEVENLAALEDAPPEVVEEVRRFARHYAEELSKPTTTPATADEPATTASPQGPSLPQ